MVEVIKLGPKRITRNYRGYTYIIQFVSDPPNKGYWKWSVAKVINVKVDGQTNQQDEAAQEAQTFIDRLVTAHGN